MTYMRILVGTSVLLLASACVTINVYFPAAAAEKAADKIIEGVWGEDAVKDKSSSRQLERLIGQLQLPSLLDLLVPAAHAQQANIDVSTPAIKKIEASMQARHGQLRTHWNSGAIGLTGDGLVAVRDAKAVPLKDRKAVNQLIAAENRDRNALYREIARANGHPEWEADIRKTFSRRWVSRAQGGWWYKSGGSWAQK